MHQFWASRCAKPTETTYLPPNCCRREPGTFVRSCYGQNIAVENPQPQIPMTQGQLVPQQTQLSQALAMAPQGFWNPTPQPTTVVQGGSLSNEMITFITELVTTAIEKIISAVITKIIPQGLPQVAAQMPVPPRLGDLHEVPSGRLSTGTLYQHHQTLDSPLLPPPSLIDSLDRSFQPRTTTETAEGK
jgi:hypothetical protein